MRPLFPLLLVLAGSLVAQDVPEGLTASEWTSIRAAYEAGRHAAYAVDGGHQARNPGQRWSTRFDGRGFLTQPDGESWTWGLELVSYGAAEEQQTVAQAERVHAEGQRVTYHWDHTLDEWYVNGANGLEHGYTVHQRPKGDGPLTMLLRVRGGLEPKVAGDGCDVLFTRDGVATITYAGLLVVDADGRRLPAHFEAVPQGLRLSIEERGARYPLTVDPVAQQAYLKASNATAFDRFGASVAVSGDTVVVGAYGESSNATGVNGNQADQSAIGAGAAYVFVRSGVTWTQQAYLKASNTNANDYFGWSVAVSGDTVVVAADAEDSNATGINGNQGDNSASGAGAAYVFVRSGVVWNQQAYLKASNTDTFDRFGASVAVSGDTVVVGAVDEDGNATGINGNQTDNSAFDSGAAYVFVRSGVTWTQQAYLKASNTGAGDSFSYSVAVSGDTVVVGAGGEDSNATGINGNQADNSASLAGAAYVFVRSGVTWTQQAYLKASNTDATDTFGWSVAVSCDTVVVGADHEDSNATGINGNQADNSAAGSGAVYVFVRSGVTWSQQAYLKASNTGAVDEFGFSVAVSGSTIVVGAWFEDSNATGINGNQADNSATNAGAAYVFVRNGVTWAQQTYLKASNTGDGDFFGGSVAVSGDTVVVGASEEGSNATGINGDQANNSASQSGAAYVFDLGTQTVYALVQQAYVKASNTGTGDYFGWSVAVSGDTVVVGAPFEDSNATGVNGNQANNGATDSGAVYVFVRSGVVWTQQAYLKASNTNANDYFGYSVAVSGDTVVVGASDEDSNATGINGNQVDNSASSSGAAYVFVRSGTTWNQQAYLKASNTGAFDIFGDAVAVSGNTVVVGAPGEASNATGINGNQANNSAGFAGAAYVFVRSGVVWTQQAYLKASNTNVNDDFGDSVALSGDTVVVGALFEGSNATGINGNQADNSATNAGAAYVFVRSGVVWSQQAYVKASNTGASDLFGYSVGVSGDTVVVGAADEDSNATGINGNQADNSATNAGAAYVFVRSGVVWSQQAYLKASNTGASDLFGSSVAVSGNTAVVGANQSCQCDSKAGTAYVFVRNGLAWGRQADLKASRTVVNNAFGYAVAVSGEWVVVGAPYEDSNATGINGNPGDNSAVDSGAAYVFNTNAYAEGCAGTNGTPALTPVDEPHLGQSYTLTITNLNPTFNLAFLAFGVVLLPPPGIDLSLLLSMPGCMAYDSTDVLLSVPAGAGGTASWIWNPVAGMVGDTFYGQALCLDPTATLFGFTVSNAITLRILN